jgi:hypothetical protein
MALSRRTVSAVTPQTVLAVPFAVSVLGARRVSRMSDDSEERRAQADDEEEDKLA